MPFEFIDNASIDRTARKRIRSRAAAGRKTNKTQPRSSKTLILKDTAATPFRDPTCLHRSEKPVAEREDPESSFADYEIDRPIDEGLIFPVPVRAEDKYLVREALFYFSGIRHNPSLDNALVAPDPKNTVWIRYFFLDEAYFHCSVATSILCFRNRVVNETAVGMRHITHTYRIVRERLSGKEALSDMTIAVLVIMSQYERIQGQYARGYIHLKGLKRMAELRGGICMLSRQCWGVVQKVLRADLEYALQLGTRTFFGADGIEALRGFDCVHIDDEGLGSGFPLDTSLQESLRGELWSIFSDMRCLAMLLHDAGVGYRQKVDGVEAHNSILLHGFRLLQVCPLGEGSKSDFCLITGLSDLENAVHLGLVAYLVTFLTGLDHRISDKPLLARRLRHAIRRLSLSIEDGEQSRMVRSVLVWTLFMGSVIVFKPEEDIWLVPMTKAAMKSLDLVSWEDVRNVLAGFPWLGALHDRAGIELCSTERLSEFA
ncbi:hypothetical protein BJX99DRAFT_265032 [Aspergillus californicus]